MSSPAGQGAQAPMEHGTSTAGGASGPPASAGPAAPQGPATLDELAKLDEPATPDEPSPGGGTQAAQPGASRRRRMAAVGLIVLLACVVVGAAAGTVAWLTHGFQRQATVEYRRAAIFSMRVGDCINQTPNGNVVHVVSCAQPHDAEIFGTFRLAGAAWPGKAVVQQDVASGCASRLGGYLNPQLAATNLTQSYVYPDRAAWTADERTVVCEIRATSGTLTGSVRGHV